LQSNGIKTLADLDQHTEAEILSFNGIGKTAIPILEKALKEKKLKFKKEKGK
jgi:DNA-directed RNA polymerase alpha subunit